MKTILVGLDGSPRAKSVLATAITVARAQGAKLILLRGVGLPPEVPRDFWQSTDDSLMDVLLRHARREIDEQAAQVPGELLDRTEVVMGSPWAAICETAARDKADLVVIGSHGYSGLDHLLGTTAAKVVNHAPCSVLVVREAPAAEPLTGRSPVSH
jgi:nucleotide-binding universal stress UspA family protein